MDDYFDQRVTPQPTAAEALPEEDDAPATHSSKGDAAAAAPSPELDTSTAPALKAAVQDLLKYGLVEQKSKSIIYRRLQHDQPAVAQILEPFDFELHFDDTRGIAFLKIAPSVATDSDEAWQHPLVRRQRLTTEQSLLVAILRQIHMAYEQDCGIGAADARIDADELRAQLDLYLGTSGSEQRDQTRLNNVLDQLSKHGIVSGPDKENQVHIRPIIVHLSDPAQLTLLLEHFKQLAKDFPADDEANVSTPTTNQARTPTHD